MTKITKTMHKFILANYKGKLTSELTNLLNKRFKTEISEKYLRSYKSRHKLRSGVDMRFGKGQKTYKPRKGYIHANSVATQFKKGHNPHNTHPIGTEVLRRDGLVWVKLHNNPGPHHIAKRWKQRARIVWEIKHGPLKEDEVILHLDGNSKNDEPSNLQVITRKQLARINKDSLIYSDGDLTKIGIQIVNLANKINQRRKKQDGS